MTQHTLKYSRYLFVYGTLMQQSDHEMSVFLKSHSKYLGNASFQGKLYDVTEFPGAILSKNSNDKVYGQIFELDAPETVFEVLDPYEGIDKRLNPPYLYTRTLVTANIENNKTIATWIYLYNLSVSHLKRIPSGRYFDF